MNNMNVKERIRMGTQGNNKHGIIAEYNGNQIPVLYLFNGNGDIITKKLGLSSYGEMKQFIDGNPDEEFLNGISQLRASFVSRMEIRNYDGIDGIRFDIQQGE